VQAVIHGGVLVVGYGNPLRSDDGVGWHVAGLLATDQRLAGARVLAQHQLVPELALDVSRASLVVLVDAAAGGDPGSVSVRRVGPCRPISAIWSHHLDPGTLAGLAEVLYGFVPPIVLVSVAAGSLAEGDRLSVALERALPEVVAVVAEVVTGEAVRPVRRPAPGW
jgi:hydrogenase maturation protease